MRVIEARNVNGIYAELVRTIRREGVLQPSRAGEVLVLDSPVMLVTHRPTERVLLDEKRDSNPFFMLMESLFLLAGRNDYTWLDRFVRNFSASFAEADGRGHGSYGWRWRSHFSTKHGVMDQLDVIVAKLRLDPNDRRAVIQMWDANVDLPTAPEPYANPYRDIPCNTHIYPRIVEGRLDLTVCCRSNDAIWGAAGANAVHFSILLEYLAGRIGVGVGRLYQLANNMHAYTARLAKYGDPQHRGYWPDAYDDPEPLKTVPIGTDWEHWDEDLHFFFRLIEEDQFPFSSGYDNFHNPWFVGTALVVYSAHWNFSQGNKQLALDVAGEIAAPDWRLACQNWIKRRMK